METVSAVAPPISLFVSEKSSERQLRNDSTGKSFMTYNIRSVIILQELQVKKYIEPFL